MTSDNPWAALIGKRVDAIWMWANELYFKCGEQLLHARMDADCCSDSWIGDVVNLPALLGGRVLAVRPINVGYDGSPAAPWPAYVPPSAFDDARTHQESEQYFGFELTTDQGHCTVVARNSSNGYYGGSFFDLVPVDELPKLAKPLTDDYAG